MSQLNMRASKVLSASIFFSLPFFLFVDDREFYYLISPAFLFAIFGIAFSCFYIGVIKYIFIFATMMLGIIYFITISEHNVALKIIYIYGTVLGVLIASRLRFEAVYVLRLGAVLIFAEFVFRFFFRVSDYISIYSLKDSFYLYPDTNYIGLVSLILYLSAQEVKSKTRFIFILGCLCSFSRMTWVLLLTSILISQIKKKWNVSQNILTNKFSLFAIGAFIPIYATLSVYENFSSVGDFIDTSLLTKFAIAYTFAEVFLSNIAALALGFGDLGSAAVVFETTGMSYTGHTIFGIVLQYGVMGIIFLVIMPFLFLQKYIGTSKSSFYIIISGLISFYPVTLFPILFLVGSRVFYAQSRENHI